MMFCLLGSGPKTGLKEFTAVMKGAVMLQYTYRGYPEFPVCLHPAIYTSTCRKNGQIKFFMFVLVCLVWLLAIYHSCHVKKLEQVPLILKSCLFRYVLRTYVRETCLVC